MNSFVVILQKTQSAHSADTQMKVFYHVMITCGHRKQFGKALLRQRGMKLPRLHHAVGVGDVLASDLIKKEDVRVFVTMMWCIWSSKDKFTRGEEGFQPIRSIALADEIVATLELPSCQEDPGGSRQHHCWPPPLEGCVVVNVDGALDVQNRVSGSGHDVRDYLGTFIEACMSQYKDIDDPFISELFACRDGIDAAIRMGVQQVIVYIDCSNIVYLWHDIGALGVNGAHMMKEIKQMSESFQGFKLLWIRREANWATHLCAKETLSFSSCTCFDVIFGFSD